MGIFTSNGDLWKHERDKVIVPELKPKKAEGMVYLMVGSANEMLASWENITDKQGGSAEVVVDESLRNFAADVISKACFGSSYSELNEIFNNIRQLQIALAEQTMIFGVPGSRYLPTNNNIEIWSLEASIRRLILDMANKRREHNAATPEDEKHLLLVDSILKGAEQAGSLISSSTTPEYDFIVDNCKNIFFAGHETTATTAAWCLMLLASHPEWQSRARAEVQEVCQGKPPDVDKLKKLSTVTSVIQETLRLYPPTPFVTREALADLKLGDRDIPRGTNIWVPIALAHRNSAVWVGDPDMFDPGRFVGGKIAAACKQPHMNIPFGMGHRTCPGQSLAMFELRVVLALLLHKFEFALSRKYVHAPAFRISVEPGEGVPLILKKLDN
ncbi:hypothetical protein BS78_K221600 [Paspalum vaginatum]|uniref:Cytochrome P450 n=1 Tax=Paspalum vaginatum TaxID=158149 RepID=A0A9W7XEI3_9POAL|nr:hypothetical protein BS78_K221600 [Paspalum vaginatum]